MACVRFTMKCSCRSSARFGVASAIAVGVGAGIGEEWLFRGVLQPLIGSIVASVVFGIAHVGGRSMLPFGVWATAMGLVLGASRL